jgi:hypothetical protein
MTIPPWLVLALDDICPEMTGGQRDRLAEQIIERLPRKAIARAIADSAKAVLGTRNVRDEAGDMSREIGNNAAQCVCVALEVAVDR